MRMPQPPHPLLHGLGALLVAAACSNNPSANPSGPLTLPPTVDGFVRAWDGSDVTSPAAAVYGEGDTIRMEFIATDAHRVRWVGIHLLEPGDVQDSVEVTDSLPAVRATFWLRSNPVFAGIMRINAFARNNTGDRAETTLRGNPVSVYARIARPVNSAALTANVRDLVLDTKRGLVYLSQPDSARIAVLSVATMTYQTALKPPGPPAGLDLSLSGDSLVVALPGTRQLGLMDLTAAAPAWSTLNLSADTTTGAEPQNLRVTASNQVLVLVTQPGVVSGAGGQLVEYDITHGTMRTRTDVGYQGQVSVDLVMIRTADRSRIVMLDGGSCCPAPAFVYQSVGDFFGPSHPTVQRYGPATSPDATGQHVLIAGGVFDNQLTLLQSYFPPGAAWAASISQSGDTAYFADGAGLLRTQLSDGVTLEKVMLPAVPQQVYSMPGAGERVLAISADTISLANLSGSLAPAPVHLAGARFESGGSAARP